MGTVQRFGRVFRVLLLALWPGVAAAGEADQELRIDAGEGISWQPQQQHYLAQGRVRIIRGDLVTWSNIARAYYRDKPDNITRLVLQGAVTIDGEGIDIQGDKAEITLGNQQITITGQHLRADVDDTVLSASDYFRYSVPNRVLEARGEVVILHGVRKLSADEMRVEWQDHDGVAVIDAVHIEGDVRADDGVSDAQKRLYLEAERGLYRPTEGTIRVCGNTLVLRGSNALRGHCAHYDVATRNFRLLGDGDLTSPLPTLEAATPPPDDSASQNANQEPVTLPSSGGRTQLILKAVN